MGGLSWHCVQFGCKSGERGPHEAKKDTRYTIEIKTTVNLLFFTNASFKWAQIFKGHWDEGPD